jgi:hypothetical protein
MSDQNLPAQNKSNQNINAQPETASDQLAPDGTTIDNLVVTKSVRIGVPNSETSEPQNRLYVVAPGGFPNNVPIVAQSVSTFFGARDSAGIERFAINLDKEGNSYPVDFYDRYDGTWRRSISLKLGKVGIGTNNPRSMLHIGDGLPIPPSGGYRPWMVRGTLVSEDSDNVFFGLKNEGPDRKDAVIAWGDNTEDAFRFIFTATGGADNGQEIMRLQSNGNVGIGTTNPEAKLHISDPSFRGNMKLFATSGVGHDFGYDGGIDNFFAFAHYGLESGQTKFVWHENEAATRDLLTIKNTGNIGIGTANPTGKLQIEDGSAPDSKIMFGSSQGGAHHLSSKRDIVFNSDNPFGTERGCFYFRKTAFDNLASHRNLVVITEAGDLKATGDVYANGILLSSSRELKENIAELSGKEAVEALKNLNPVKFNFKSDSDKNRHIGFIAEDVPELVATSDRKTLSPMDIVAVLTQALKEQQNTISALAEKVKLLEAKTA